MQFLHFRFVVEGAAGAGVASGGAVAGARVARADDAAELLAVRVRVALGVASGGVRVARVTEVIAEKQISESVRLANDSVVDDKDNAKSGVRNALASSGVEI